MDARQSKALIQAAERACAVLNPDWSIFSELKTAIAAAKAKPAVRGRKLAKDTNWAGARAHVDACWAPDGIIMRLQAEAACKHCEHGPGEHTAIKRCSCGCENYKPEDERYYSIADEKCANCEHKAKAHKPAHHCLETCACRKYEATREHSYNIAVEAARSAQAQPKVDVSALSTCACGHGSEAHKRDELENLLTCEAADCTCDHFHYAHSEDAAIAA